MIGTLRIVASRNLSCLRAGLAEVWRFKINGAPVLTAGFRNSLASASDLQIEKCQQASDHETTHEHAAQGRVIQFAPRHCLVLLRQEDSDLLC
jgi:hypothetical protein